MVMVFIYISLSKKNVEVFSNKIKIKRMVEWKNLNVGLTWAFLMGRYCQFRRDVGAKKNEALPRFGCPRNRAETKFSRFKLADKKSNR